MNRRTNGDFILKQHSRLVSFLRGTDLVFRRVHKIAKIATDSFIFFFRSGVYP